MATNGKIEIDTTYGHPDFYALVAKMAETHAVKNQDYGGGNPLGNFYGVKQFNGDPVEGVMTRLSDKWSRLCNLHAKGGVGAVKDESIEDTALDLACYGLLYIVIRRECNSGGPRTTDLMADELFNELVRGAVSEGFDYQPEIVSATHYEEDSGTSPIDHIGEVKKQVEEERHQAELRLKGERDKWYKRYLDMEANYLNLIEEVALLQMDKAGLEREMEGLTAQIDAIIEGRMGVKRCSGSCLPGGDRTHIGRSSPGLAGGLIRRDASMAKEGA